jgi:hypothetical protein
MTGRDRHPDTAGCARRDPLWERTRRRQLRGVNGGIDPLGGLTADSREGLKPMNDVLNYARSTPFLIPGSHQQ